MGKKEFLTTCTHSYLKACFHIFILASYDSTGSIPTTDISMETHSSHVTQESTYPKRNQPVPHSQQPRKPVEDPFISPASHQVCCRSSLSKHKDFHRQPAKAQMRLPGRVVWPGPLLLAQEFSYLSEVRTRGM